MGFADLTAVDVTAWSEQEREQRGKRSKSWVVDPSDGSSWLRKSVSESPPRPYEHQIEAFVLELARQSGVDSATSRPCFWEESGMRRSGLVSRSFVNDGQSLVSGAEFLSPLVRPQLEKGVAEKHAYSLELVLGACRIWSSPHPALVLPCCECWRSTLGWETVTGTRKTGRF